VVLVLVRILMSSEIRKKNQNLYALKERNPDSRVNSSLIKLIIGVINNSRSCSTIMYNVLQCAVYSCCKYVSITL
jgi:hypothetical protein